MSLNFINRIINDNCLNILKELESESIDLVITSPPYDNLRDYKGFEVDLPEIIKGLFRIIKDGELLSGFLVMQL